MKLVREHINFQRNIDPKDAMKTGGLNEFLEELDDAPCRQKGPAWYYIEKPILKKIIKFLFEKGWTYERVKKLVYSRHMEWQYTTYPTYDEEVFKKYYRNNMNGVQTFWTGRENKGLREHNFKRNIEPKDAMKTGLSPEEKVQHILDACEEDSELTILRNTAHKIAKENGYKSTYDYINKLMWGHHDLDEPKLHSNNPEIEDALENVEKRVEYILLNTFNLQNQKLINDFANFYNNGEPPYWTFVTQTAPYFKSNESNFERKIEPKDAMSTGYHADLKQRAEAIQWDWEFDQPVDEKVLDIINYKSIPIKVSLLKKYFKHLSQDHYLAISSTGEPYMNDPISYSTPEQALKATKENLDREFQYLMTNESLENDSRGYNIGDFVYHITPSKNIHEIEKNGMKPKDGIAVNGKSYKNRLYFATSLIAAYDLYVNFTSIRDEQNYIILKIDSACLKDYEKDPLFMHGIYVNYPINKQYILEIIKPEDLFGQFNDDDFDKLYE